ncbi:U3 small nucleolar RNA-associated protein 11 [Spathaspora sp. JA1]|nr:U3 small nucleolar RNA-associated protein 11 [Spathaspora sp. JA1]
MAKLVHNVQKKQHRERSQTSSRAKYGLLEKKKDYKLRAADYHKKQAALKALKEKAKLHNPDEYYHSMTKRHTDDRGILVADRDVEDLSNDQIKLLKTQDINYIRTIRLNEQKKIERDLQSKLFEGSGKHTVFVDSVTEQQEFSPAEFFNTDESLVNNRENRLRLQQLYDNTGVISDKLEVEVKDKVDSEKVKSYKVLQRRLKKEQDLKKVELIMSNKLETMKKGNKKKIVDQDGKVQFKWKNQRKR